MLFTLCYITAASFPATTMQPGRPRSGLWADFEEFGSSTHPRARCRGCGEEISGQPERLKAHAPKCNKLKMADNESQNSIVNHTSSSSSSSSSSGQALWEGSGGNAKIMPRKCLEYSLGKFPIDNYSLEIMPVFFLQCLRSIFFLGNR